MDDKYYEYAHGMQSGVAAFMNINPEETTPKHLRVGINIALRDMASLCKLLENKGLITKEELKEYLINGMKEEKEDYEKRLSEYYGKEIKLH